MSIVTQYGIRITDRVRVEETTASGAPVFSASFDGEPIPGYSYTCAGAIRIAQAWLKKRDEQRVADKMAEAAREKADAAADDQRFLWNLAVTLGIGDSDMDRLIEIIGRRTAA